MLHTKTIEPRTLSILNELMHFPELDQFSLVGGTALSLKYGHRISVDLDLFSDQEMNKDLLIDFLKTKYTDRFIIENTQAKWGIFCYIDNVKIDIVQYPHSLIGKIENLESIRFYSDKDLMAMKIQAILGRGKKKDFWDIAELLQHYSIQDIIDCHKAKYPNQMLGISIPQALTYFVDADESEEPITIKPITWDDVKSVISAKVRKFLQ